MGINVNRNSTNRNPLLIRGSQSKHPTKRKKVPTGNKLGIVGVEKTNNKNVNLSPWSGTGKFAIFGKRFEQKRKPVKPITKKDIYGR